MKYQPVLDLIYYLLRFWHEGGAFALAILASLLLSWSYVRMIWVEHRNPLAMLHNRFGIVTRYFLLHRRSRKTVPFALGLLAFAIGVFQAVSLRPVWIWSYRHGLIFFWIHGALLLMAMVIGLLWNRVPSYVKYGEGRADAQFRDIQEEWGQAMAEDGRTYRDPTPTAELLVLRSPSRKARRLVGGGQHFRGNLTLLALRWDILSRHVFVVGPQGSGKTASFYAPIMHTSRVPWVYQDSKAELPFREDFTGVPVFGFDVRGHETRSGVWNPMEEIRSADDFDLLVDYVFPKNPKDPNGWVRDMARVIFGAVLRSRRWESLQQVARTLRGTRLELFLEALDPIYQDAMKEPKSQVPVLQDLVVTLSRWETQRVRAITEGRSTVTLGDFIERGGYIMNCEDSDALKVPVHVFWAMLLGRLRNRPEGAEPLLLLLDEFGDAGRIPNVQRALALLRSKGVSIVAGIQNLGLLQDVYPQDWKAVLEGFGTRIWLARNLEDGLRQRLSQALGKFTRRIPPASKNAKESEKEADLMPLDAWGQWSESRVALGRLHGFTYWLPVAIPIPKTPLGPRMLDGDPWADSQTEAIAAAKSALTAMSLPEWCMQVPFAPPHAPELALPSAQSTPAQEDDWL